MAKFLLLSLISFSNAEIMASASSSSSLVSIKPKDSPEPFSAINIALIDYDNGVAASNVAGLISNSLKVNTGNWKKFSKSRILVILTLQQIDGHPL